MNSKIFMKTRFKIERHNSHKVVAVTTLTVLLMDSLW